MKTKKTLGEKAIMEAGIKYNIVFFISFTLQQFISAQTSMDLFKYLTKIEHAYNILGYPHIYIYLVNQSIFCVA